MTYQPKSPSLVDAIPGYRFLTWTLFILLTLFIIGIIIIPWQQTVSGYGKVVAYSPTERVQVISAPLDGRIEQWFVVEGSHVKKGQPIVKVSDLDPNYLQRLELEKNALQLQLSAAIQAEKLAKKNAGRQQLLFKKGISSQRTYEQAKYEEMRYLSEIAKVKASLAKIDVQIARQQQQLVKAPMAGTILKRMTGTQSIIVKSGQVLAELVPDTASRAAEIFIDGNDVPLVQVNDIVSLQFEGWPAIQFSGWPSVAVGTFPGKVAFVDNADNGQGLFRVIVLPQTQTDWPSANYLRQGVKVHGWIMLKQVKIYFELWRRFNGFPPYRDKPK